MKKILSSLLLFFFCKSVLAVSFNEMVFFGDSLTDNGNIYHVLKIIPKSPPYYQGRFSNGPTWAEDVANYYFGKYKTTSQNYAYGGATAVIHSPMSDTFVSPMQLQTEINLYLLHSMFTDKSKVLYFFWMGANDYLYEKTPDVRLVTDQVVERIYKSILTLVKKGGDNFLILNLPDLSQTPYAQAHQITNRLRVVTMMHNQKLKLKVEQLKEEYPATRFTLVDVNTSFHDLLADPAKYNEIYHQNISNVKDTCWTGDILARSFDEKANLNLEFKQSFKNQKTDVANLDSQAMAQYVKSSPALLNAYRMVNTPGTICSHPDTYVFWDSLHPTAAVHQIFAAVVVQMLKDLGEG